MPNGERFAHRHLANLLVGIGGIVVRSGRTAVLDNRFVGGVLASQLACAGWALGSVNAHRRGQDENVLAAVAVQMVAAGLCLWIPALARGESATLQFTERTATAFLYLMLVGRSWGSPLTRTP